MEDDTLRTRSFRFLLSGVLLGLFTAPLLHAAPTDDDSWWESYFGHPQQKPDNSNPGNGVTELYYDAPDGNAFIYSPDSDDVRTEGMSYGMMICVQTGHQKEFDKLWKWVKAHMAMPDPGMRGYNYWHCRIDGSVIDDGGPGSKCGAAPDGEEYFATALFFASHRWGDKSGIDYGADAKTILHAMIHNTHPMFVTETGASNPSPQVVFVPSGGVESTFTDPSYHLPAFYELWAKWDVPENRAFWKSAAAASRTLIAAAAHPVTGLTPDYARFDGTPYTYQYNQKSPYFTADAWRVVMNAAVDWKWNQAALSERTLCDRVQTFILSKSGDGNPRAESGWTLDGKTATNPYGDQTGLLAMNAVAGLAATNSEQAKRLFSAFASRSLPSGHWRYYSAMLSYLAHLHISDAFQIY